MDYRSFKVIKMAPIDRSYAIYYWSAIVTMALSGIIFELFDVEYCCRCCDLDI